VKNITSRQNPIVRTFRALADDPDPTGERVLLDGSHLVGEAQAAGAVFELLVVAASQLGTGSEEEQLARRLETAGIDVVVADDKVFAALSPVKTPSGIAAIVRRKVTAPSIICGRPQAFVVAAVDVQDPGNVGALIRVAEAGGATGAFVCGSSASPFSWKALRGSMGSALRLPTVAGMTADAVMNCTAEAGVRMIAAVPRDGQRPEDIAWRGTVALFLGGEGPGLTDEVIARCDARVSIPMVTAVESLNVAVAAAVLIYAARRQRIDP
jgi:RNA methyltransferase, TrmH family